VCTEQGFATRMERLDIPYFGEVLELTYTCSSCGWRRTDLHIVHEKEPVRYRMRVTRPEHLTVRVVRSASCHFEVPELGVRAEPSEAAEAFVSNTEGVLERCASAIRAALNGAEDGETRQRAGELLEKAQRMRDVDEPWTVLLEDPMGNSVIVSDEAERTVLTREEADALGHPYAVIDVSERER
jgi:zinc finger protein